jgi:hypothetical protein
MGASPLKWRNPMTQFFFLLFIALGMGAALILSIAIMACSALHFDAKMAMAKCQTKHSYDTCYTTLN